VAARERHDGLRRRGHLLGRGARARPQPRGPGEARADRCRSQAGGDGDPARDRHGHQGRGAVHRGGRRSPEPGLDTLHIAQPAADHLRRAALPGDEGPLRLPVRVRRVLRRRHGRSRDPRVARGAFPALERRGAGQRGAHRPSRGGRAPSRDDHDLEGPEAGPRAQAPSGRLGVHPQRQPARVDDPRGRARDPAGASADGAARRRSLRNKRPERPLSPRHQPQQPAEAPARPGRPRDHREQREAHAAGGRRRAVRQRPPRPRGDRPRQPTAEVAVGHAEGQAGPLPPEPAREARRLLRPLGHRGRPGAQAAPVRPAEADGP